MKKNTSVSMSVDVSFYNKIEKDRRIFMKKLGLTNLSTRAFTKVLSNKNWIDGGKNVKKKQ